MPTRGNVHDIVLGQSRQIRYTPFTLRILGGGADRPNVGNVFFVDSVTGANETSRGSLTQPFASFHYASTRCTANNGDVVYGFPGHVETIGAAAAFLAGVAGVRFVGVGTGRDRPLFNITATAGDLEIDAVDVSIENCVIDATGIDAVVAAIDVDAAGFLLMDCEILMAIAARQAVNIITPDGNASRMRIFRNTFIGSNNAGLNQAILLAGTPDDIEIAGNHIVGACAVGVISNAAANVVTNVRIHNNYIKNFTAGQEAIDFDSAVTGMISNNDLVTDALATAIDPGSCAMFNNRWHPEGQDFESVPALPVSDQTTNLLGVDNANNAAATTNIAGNRDGSVLERLEQVQEDIRRGTGSGLAANESLVDILYGTGGITTWPAAAAPGNGVSLAEGLRWLDDAVQGANGVVTFPAAAAPANGISIAEVLREIYDQANKSVVNTTATLVNGTTIFTIAGGPIEILSLVARCVTGNDATASTLQWSADPTDGAAATFSGASASLASALAGATVVLQGTTLVTAPIVNTSGVGLGQQVTNGIIIGAGIITTTIGVGSTTGTWQHHLRYRPLSRGVTVT